MSPDISLASAAHRAHSDRQGNSAPSFSVQVVHTTQQLESHVPAWEALAKTSIEPNPFYEPWMLLPALAAFGKGREYRFVLVYRGPSRAREEAGIRQSRAHEEAENNPQLIGFFPFEVRRRYKRLPVRVLALWKHLHCFLCTPLVHRDFDMEAMRELFSWARRDAQAAGLLDFDPVHGDGPFAQLLAGFIQKEQVAAFTSEVAYRALLRPARACEDYLAAARSTGNRKELRRQRRRLSELGGLETKLLGPGDDGNQWIESFLELEGRGWKGQEGTALGASPVERTFFTDIARNAFARGRLQMLGLFLDGKPIALKCNFLVPPGAFAFKIAFDEAYARYSPGVQLELDNIENVHRSTDIQWMDSCATAQHFMINRLWRERRAIQSVLLSTGRATYDLVVGAMPLARIVRNLCRRIAPSR
ncbi:MAG: GNAT family N-acetyltransferase [Gemmataceae bacterium]|nr:GNAT family N-acetyltransferase [Gemmataceae bacterium]